MNTSVLNVFIADAKSVGIAEALPLLGLPAPKGGQAEYMGPCPLCGGKDRFSYNIRKDVWNCRGCGTGGHGALGLAGHLLGFDLQRRDGLLGACAAVLGRPAPDAQANETEEERLAREEKAAQKRAKAQEAEQKRQKQAENYRKVERRKAAQKWSGGRLIGATPYARYIELRCGALVSAWPLRLLEREPYFFEQKRIYSGPAMVAPFVAQSGEIIGCHLTWLDLQNPPKYRPILPAAPVEPALPTKKMRGSKKGGLIPLRGFIWKERAQRFAADKNRQRMVVGEGIETVLAMCLAEGEREDTIYAAAGDMGNLTGPATPESRFVHPDLTHTGKDGRKRPVYVAGPVPLMTPESSIWVPDWISELVLIADSDSEPVMTAAAMVRAAARFTKEYRKIPVLWPPRGMDIADMMVLLTKPETTFGEKGEQHG